jgi:hypothetical protein
MSTGRVSSSKKIWGGSVTNEWAYVAHQVPWGVLREFPDCFRDIFKQKEMLVIWFGDLL